MEITTVNNPTLRCLLYIFVFRLFLYIFTEMWTFTPGDILNLDLIMAKFSCNLYFSC